MGERFLRCLVVLMLVATIGCATERVVTITARPPDATIKIDGVERGKAPVVETFTFTDNDQAYQVVAQRPGYKDAIWRVTRDFTDNVHQIELSPLTRRVSVNVGPVPAIISINGKPVDSTPRSLWSGELEFTLDAMNKWYTYEITAERPGFQTARQNVTWTDREPTYSLQLQPLEKQIRVTSKPEGAQIFLDGRSLGSAPTAATTATFEVDPLNGRLKPKRLRAEKAGFDPVEMPLTWDNGQTDYEISLLPKMKQIRLTTNPPSVDLRIEGLDDFRATTNDEGAVGIELAFLPINEQGDLRTYKILASKKPEDDREWYPGDVTVAWDNGRTDYHVDLREILTRPVPLLSIAPKHEGEDWIVEAQRVETIAMKDTAEPGGQAPTRVYTAAEGEFIDSLAVAPDGQHVAMAVLPGAGNLPLRSELRSVRTNGSGGEQQLTDGGSLDLMPSYTPDGRKLVFASNRMSMRLSICSMATDGRGGVTQHTDAETHYDAWPAVDSDPQAKLYYSRFMKRNREDPRLYSQQLEGGGGVRTDLTATRGGTRPRPNPKADAIVFESINGQGGKRDLFRLPEGQRPENLTNTADADEFDAVWSRDGTRLLYVSDRGRHDETGNNRDIWLLDLNKPEQPIQLTANGSWDDCPAWDPSGNAIYFRSNRGGQWGVWRMDLK